MCVLKPIRHVVSEVPFINMLYVVSIGMEITNKNKFKKHRRHVYFNKKRRKCSPNITENTIINCTKYLNCVFCE